VAAKGGQSYLKSIANEALSDDFCQKSINGEALNNDLKKGMLMKHYMLTALTCGGRGRAKMDVWGWARG
jgi:adenosylcobinamide amidohydrolase